MANGFKDFIPEGEDNGAVTKDGYQDFVPTSAKEIKVKQPTENVKEFVCTECGFVAKAKIGLAGHMRKHK